MEQTFQREQLQVGTRAIRLQMAEKIKQSPFEYCLELSIYHLPSEDLLGTFGTSSGY